MLGESLGPPPGVGDFIGREASFKESLPMPVQQALNPADFDKINAMAQNAHGKA